MLPVYLRFQYKRLKGLGFTVFSVLEPTEHAEPMELREHIKPREPREPREFREAAVQDNDNINVEI